MTSRLIDPARSLRILSLIFVPGVAWITHSRRARLSVGLSAESSSYFQFIAPTFKMTQFLAVFSTGQDSSFRKLQLHPDRTAGFAGFTLLAGDSLVKSRYFRLPG